MPKRKVSEMRSIDLNLTERLHERLLNCAAEDGMTFDGYVESALLAAVLDTEKRVSRSRLNRDPKEYPHQCDYCEDRFKLPMHKARHIKWTHPEMAPDDEGKPQVTLDIDSINKQIVESTLAAAGSVQMSGQDPRFKLAPGIDQAMLDEFDHAYYADVPRLD